MTTLGFAILAAVVAAVITWLALRTRVAALQQQLAGSEQQVAMARQQANAAEQSLQSERAQTTALTAERAALEARLEAERDAAQKRLELDRKAAEEKLALLNRATEELREAFQALSAEALKSNNQSFLELAKETLKNYQTEARGDLEQRKQAVQSLVEPIRRSLESVDTQIRELEKTRSEAYGSLRTQVASLITTQEKLQSETGNLVKALRAPQVRGRWGEIQLRRVVEMAGMLPYCDFAEQVSLDTTDGKLRPDLIVKLPGGKTVVVDAKAPLQAYLNALESEDDEARRNALADHARQIRTHMAQLGSKAYWDQLTSAPDFVVMFLPGETFFSAALQQDPALIEYGVSQKVIPASPTTLIALLQAVAYGWRQERIAESAQEISERGKELYDRLCTLAGYVRELGSTLGRSVEHYNKAIASLETRVLVTARKFPELGVSAKEEIPELAPIEKNVRQLQAIEFVTNVKIAELAASSNDDE